MAYKTDPREVGKKKSPLTNETSQVLRDSDQRWFTEVQGEFPSDGQVWDGSGYRAAVQRVANRYVASQIRRVARRQG